MNRRGGDPDVVLRLLVLRADPSNTVLEDLEHRWSSRYYYDNLEIDGDQIRVVLMFSSDRQPWQRHFYTRRASDRSNDRPQVVNVSNVVHLLLDPVVPTPARRRVVLPGWVYAQGTQPGGRGGLIRPPSSINPSVIPAVPGRANPSDEWSRYWRARLLIHRWFHRGPFAEREVTWRFEATEGSPSVEIDGRGVEVTALGRGEGEGVLIASVRGQDRAQMRVLVREPVRLRTRAIVIVPNAPHTGDEAAVMRGVTEQSFNAQLHVANRFLRQVAVQLRPATVEYRAGVSVGVNVDHLHSTTSTYGQEGVVTFVLVHSAIEVDGGTITPSSTLGIAAGIPRSGAPTSGGTPPPQPHVHWAYAAELGTFIDRGTPSSSLLPPTGIPPDDPAEPTRLTIIREAACNQAVVFLIMRAGTETGLTGATIAHEMGHVFNLAHRHGDGVPWLGSQNLMLSSSSFFDANDLDVAQAKVIWHSPLLTGSS